MAQLYEWPRTIFECGTWARVRMMAFAFVTPQATMESHGASRRVWLNLEETKQITSSISPSARKRFIVVLYDPEDPDPARRFDMVFEYLPETTWGTAASSDGLR